MMLYLIEGVDAIVFVANETLLDRFFTAFSVLLGPAVAKRLRSLKGVCEILDLQFSGGIHLVHCVHFRAS
jgi:hypothetical protein